MSVRLSDNCNDKAMTVERVNALFRSIALLTVRRDKIKAACEKRIADLKAAADRELDPLDAELKDMAAELAAYIDHNSDRFIKPRQRVTDYGKYGLRTVSNLEIVDEELAKANVRARGIPALVVTEKLDKKALEKAISDEKEIDGVEFRTGEIASYTVAKALAEE